MFRTKGVIYTCAFAATAALCAGGWFYLESLGTEVVDFVSREKSFVASWAEENRLSDYVLYQYRFDEEISRNIVISQSVPAGEKLRKGDILSVVISEGKDPDRTFEIPDFTGKKKDEAAAWFETNGFTDVTYEYKVTDDGKYSDGEFMSSKPEAGMKVKRSESVTVTFAAKTGADITLPDLSLYTLANMKAWAEQNKVTLHIRYIQSSYPEGTVISMDPAPGTVIHAGDEVEIVYSSGSQDEETSQPADNVLAAPVQTAQPQVQTPAPTPEPSAAPTPVTSATPEPEKTPEPEPEQPVPPQEPEEPVEPEEPAEPEPEPAGGCPVSIMAMLFTNKTADDVISYYGTNNCSWNVINLDDSFSNPNNYQGVAAYEQTSTTTANLYMFIRWQ